MKKIILSILIILSFFYTINAFASDINNNNNNNRKCPELPDDVWLKIASQLINIKAIYEAKTIPELKKGFYKFLLLSKKHNKLAVDLANKEFEIGGKKITLKNLYIQRKNEIIIKSIKAKLEHEFTFYKFDWFNSINAQYENGLTALMITALYGNKEITKLLVQNHADLNLKDKNGNTALMTAAYYNHKEIAELLIESGADIDAICKRGGTALMHATSKGFKEIVELLVKNHADLNLKDENGNTALMTAAYYNYKEIAELLIKSGANIDAICKRGGTALMHATFQGCKEIAELLVQNHADLNLKDKNGNTALMTAAYYNHKEIAELLIKSGANTDCIPLFFIINLDREIAKLIIKNQISSMELPRRHEYSCNIQ